MNQTNIPKKNILIMAGGTGGHVFPALAIAKALANKGLHIEWLGTKRGLEAEIVPKAGFTLNTISIAGLRGKGFLKYLFAPFQLLYAFVQSLILIHKLKPSLVIGMGGFASGPGGVSAFILGYPLIIHEQNAVVGFTNRLLKHIATRTLEGFPGSFKSKKAIYTGNPVREELCTLALPEERLKERQGPLRLLILGGSQGSQALNQLCPKALSLIPLEFRPFVTHQAGKGNQERTEKAYKDANVLACVEAFIHDMAKTYDWADLVICRSGALTVAELSAVGLGSILVPFPYAVDDHQTQNGRYLEQGGAATLIPQALLDSNKLADIILNLSQDRARVCAMAKSARNLGVKDASVNIVRHCIEVCGE